MADTELTDLSEVTDPLDDDIFYMVDDPAGTPANAKVKKRRLYWGGAIVPYFTNTAVHIGYPHPPASSAFAMVADRLYAHPVIVPYRRAFTSIACWGTTATGNVRMGIYNTVFSAANGWAIGTLVAETASTAVGASALTTAAITATLDEGVYYLAAVFDGTPTMRGYPTGTGSVFGQDLAVGPQNAPVGMYSAHTYGALPNLTGIAQTLGAPPALGIK